MATIELTLSSDYVPNWGLWEGIRELVQNAVDGEREMGYKMTIHRTDGGTVVIHNAGGTLPREALLIGFSTKRNNAELIGKYGEGFKLGLLALVRSGFDVTIRNGRETWIPCLERSEKFNSDVLKFKITQAQNDSDGLKIMVKGVSSQDWETFQARFLFLAPTTNTVETQYGTILRNPQDRGKVYVKGIYVQHNDQLGAGYNFSDADLDRDRRMVDSYDLRYKASMIWRDAISSDPTLIDSMFDLLLDSSIDLKNIGDYIHGESVDKLLACFTAKYGDGALPVENYSQAQELAHFGGRGIVVPQKLVNALANKLGNFDKIKDGLSNTAFTLVSPCDLSTVERKNLENAVAALTLVESSFDPSTLNVACFIDTNKRGLHIEGKLYLSKGILASQAETVMVLIHEYCHKYGKDGERSFTDGCAELASRIIASLV